MQYCEDLGTVSGHSSAVKSTAKSRIAAAGEISYSLSEDRERRSTYCLPPEYCTRKLESVDRTALRYNCIEYICLHYRTCIPLNSDQVVQVRKKTHKLRLADRSQDPEPFIVLRGHTT